MSAKEKISKALDFLFGANKIEEDINEVDNNINNVNNVIQNNHFGDEVNYVHTLKIKGLNNEMIWDDSIIWELAFGHNLTSTLNGEKYNQGLLTAIDKCSITHFSYDQSRNQMITIPNYFSDFVIFIPKQIWHNCANTIGHPILVLADRLRQRHTNSFLKEHRYNNRKPNFCIMPAEAHHHLENNEILIQFGLGVFIPNDEDVLIRDLSYMIGGNIGYTLKPWIFFDSNGNQFERPAALYRNQRHIVFAQNESLLSCFSLKNYEFPPRESIIFRTSFDDRGEITKCQLIHPENAGYSTDKTIVQNNVYNYSVDRHVSNQHEKQYFAVAIKPRDADFARPINIRDNIVDTNTFVGLANQKQEIIQPMVALSHLAFPDLGMIQPAFDRWEIAFNKDGNLISTYESAEKPFIRFFLQENNLYYQDHKMEEAKLFDGDQISVDEMTFKFLPSPEIPQDDASLPDEDLPAEYLGAGINLYDDSDEDEEDAPDQDFARPLPDSADDAENPETTENKEENGENNARPLPDSADDAENPETTENKEENGENNARPLPDSTDDAENPETTENKEENGENDVRPLPDSADDAENPETTENKEENGENDARPLPENQAQKLNNRYLKLLALPEEWQKVMYFPIKTNTIELGRANHDCHDNLLNLTGTLCSGNSISAQTLHDISFSKKHAEISYLKNGRVIVRQISKTSPIIVLNERLQYENELLPNDDRVMYLKNRQAIILGCYVFRFYNLSIDNE